MDSAFVATRTCTRVAHGNVGEATRMRARTAWQPFTHLGNSPRRSYKSEARLDKLDNGHYRFVFERIGRRVFSFPCETIPFSISVTNNITSVTR